MEGTPEVKNCEKCNARMIHKICCCSERAMGYEAKLECPQCGTVIYQTQKN
jgi:ribosomal protein L33